MSGVGREDDEKGAQEESTDKEEEDLRVVSEVVLGSEVEEKTNHEVEGKGCRLLV